MASLTWYYNRLRAMNMPEVWWRITQKALQMRESAAVRMRKIDPSSQLLYRSLRKQDKSGLFAPKADIAARLKTQFEEWFAPAQPDATIHLLGGFDYDDYATRWHAGFNTEAEWPMVQSYSLRYKQRDDIGDARINWELNRCYQFALFARRGNYDQLDHQLDSWCKANPWLMGISYTSVMEVAIRAIQWAIAAMYIPNDSKRYGNLQRRLTVGALNMTAYVSRHYSRYSSANNHLVVEACCMVVVGSIYGIERWKKLGMEILDRELFLQNYPDGVNKEMSLHYQAFVMEAYALAMLAMAETPQNWCQLLNKMCDFVKASIQGGVVMEWGDNDEGKILDLVGGDHESICHYQQVLKMMSSVGIPGNNIHKHVQTFPDGGYTFVRGDNSDNTVLGIDHGPLGFGSIAAHGHADALSLQLAYRGKMIFADPGTYVYHRDIESRNHYRRTINHNTVCVQGRDQSEMRGAFMWGKRAEAELDNCTDRKNSGCRITVQHNGYAPIIHSRKVTFDYSGDFLRIDDELSSPTDFTLTFILGPQVEVQMVDKAVVLSIGGKEVANMTVETKDGRLSIERERFSPTFGSEQATTAIRVRAHDSHIYTFITLNEIDYTENPKANDEQ